MTGAIFWIIVFRFLEHNVKAEFQGQLLFFGHLRV